MGSFFTDILSFQHETAVFDVNPHQLRFVYNTYRFTTLEEIKEFEPELVINAVTLKYTLEVFRQVIPHLPQDCILSDISSVKTGFKEFYEGAGMRYVSTAPDVRSHVCQSGEPEPRERHRHQRRRLYGAHLFPRLIHSTRITCLRIFVRGTRRDHGLLAQYSFRVDFHLCCGDETSGCTGHDIQTPSENSSGRAERRRLPPSGNPFQPRTKSHVERIREELKNLIHIIDERDEEGLNRYLTRIRENIK